MKKSLLVAVFLLPIAWAKLAPSQIQFVTDCSPCNGTLTVNASPSLSLPECLECIDVEKLTAAKALPTPDCWPCDDVQKVAATQALPVPDCWPCDDVHHLAASKLLPAPNRPFRQYFMHVTVQTPVPSSRLLGFRREA